jgi:nitrogenase molybdenum-iron protein alpha/beta subunit
MRHCINPLWPCALTGAVSALSGFKGLAVVIHGSSGCYYYPATLLHRDLHSTFLVEQEVVFGTGERLLEVVKTLIPEYEKIAVVTSCVTSVIGEDIRTLLDGYDVILVDSPGFMGDFEAGYHSAVNVLPVLQNNGLTGINIEGINLADPFSSGNQREAVRLLGMMGIQPGVVFCNDTLQHLNNVPEFSVSVNPDLNRFGRGNVGSFLGISGIKTVVKTLTKLIAGSNPGPVEDEIVDVEERVIRASDKYLRRYDPPAVAIFSTYSYCKFAEDTLKRYLDAEIVFCGSRNIPPPGDTTIERVTSLAAVEDAVHIHSPDLVLGSSFEKSIAGNAAFVGLTPPLRGTIRLSSCPIAGTEGTLAFMEGVLNACMDRRKC